MTEQRVGPGDQVRSARSKSGRVWRVRAINSPTHYALDPQGSDVMPARSDKTGRWQGGVRSIRVPIADLRLRERWEKL